MPEPQPSTTLRKATSKQDPTWTTRGSSAGNEFRLTHSQYDLPAVHTYSDVLTSVLSILTALLVDSIHLFFLPINPVLLKTVMFHKCNAADYLTGSLCFCLKLEGILYGELPLCVWKSERKRKKKSSIESSLKKSSKAFYIHLTVFHATEVLLIIAPISTAFSADLCARSMTLQKAQLLWNVHFSAPRLFLVRIQRHVVCTFHLTKNIKQYCRVSIATFSF